MNKRVVVDLLKYVLALALLAYLIWANWGTPGSNGIGDVWQRHAVEHKPIDYGYLLAAFGLGSAGLALTLYRWYLLVRAQDLPFSVPDAFRIGLVGVFFNTFLPGSVGGDIIKAAFLAREQSRRTVAVATVIMDRVIALWALIWFVAILGGVFWAGGSLEGASVRQSKTVVLAAGAIVAVSLAVWVLMGFLPQARAERFAGRLQRLPRVGHSAAEFWRAVWMYRCRQRSVYLVMLISWVGQVGFVLAFYCAARVLWDEADRGGIPGLVQHFLLVPVGLVVRALPLLPGGLGVGELGFRELYRWFGGRPEAGVLASLVQRVIEWTMAFGGLAIYLHLRTRLADARAALDAAAKPVAAVPAAVGEG